MTICLTFRGLVRQEQQRTVRPDRRVAYVLFGAAHPLREGMTTPPGLWPGGLQWDDESGI